MITKEWLVFPIGLMTVLAGHLAGHALNRLLFEHRIFSRRNSWHAWLWIAFVLFYMFWPLSSVISSP